MTRRAFANRLAQDMMKGQRWLPLVVLAAAGSSLAAGEQEARVQLSRQQSQVVQLQTQLRGIEGWRESMQSDAVLLKARYDGLHDIQRQLHTQFISLSETQEGLRADHQSLDLRLSEMTDQVPTLADTQQQAAIKLAQADTQSGNRSMVQLINQMETLNGELNKLRGKIEELGHGINNAEKRQRDMYLDLDTRMRRLEQALAAAQKKEQENFTALEERLRKLEQGSQAAGIPAPVTSAAGSEGAGTTGPIGTANAAPAAAPDPQRLYDQALNAYRMGNYTAAAGGFQDFLKQFPQHGLADNAQYWMGETYFQLRDYKGAVEAQRRLMTSYPNSPKVPDALLNMGSAELGLGDSAAARKAWEELVSKHPDSEAADKARQRLARLR